ncbi:MAG: mechanosensitive ion channel [Deltaproteobacteria bacterium]|nr:mechanosensitive ion channel [Deltaproteobacteria bacterium]
MNLHIDNYTQRKKMLYRPRISLRYETTPDQIRYILTEIKKLLTSHPKVLPDPTRVRFTNFGAYSLDLDIFAYIDETRYGEFLEIAEDLNLQIMDIVTKAGSSFAFPSQTTYIESGAAERASIRIWQRLQGTVLKNGEKKKPIKSVSFTLMIN